MNLCTITMLTSLAPVLRCSRSSAVLEMTFTRPPISLAVRASCCSRSTRSLTRTILKSCRSSAARTIRATKTMVRDLPEPWVCQITPERSSCPEPDRSRSTILRAARYCWYRLTTLIRAPESVSMNTVQVRSISSRVVGASSPWISRSCARTTEPREEPVAPFVAPISRSASGSSSTAPSPTWRSALQVGSGSRFVSGQMSRQAWKCSGPELRVPNSQVSPQVRTSARLVTKSRGSPSRSPAAAVSGRPLR